MAIFDRVLKKETQARLDMLVERVTQMAQDLEMSSELPFVLAKKHVAQADANCTTAIKRFAEQSFGVALSLIEKAELHLHMSHTLIGLNEADRFELHFPPNSANGLVLDLGNAIADLKFCIEYTNAKIPEDQTQTLMTVMYLWWEGCEALSRGDEKTARRFAELGLLLVHIAVLNINAYNDQGSPVIVRNNFSNPLFTKIREFAEQLSQTSDAMLSTDKVSAQAREHLEAAAKNLSDTMSHLVAGRDGQADTCTTAGLLELKYVQRLAPTAVDSGSKNPNPFNIRELRDNLAAKVQTDRGDDMHKSLYEDERKRLTKHQATGSQPTGGAIETYNRIVELLSKSDIPQDSMLRALSKLQSAVHFLEQAKRKTDRAFANDLCGEALADLGEARALCL